MAESFKGGQAATLFPLLTNGLEDRATCIFFAVFELVHAFRDCLLQSVNQKAYKSGNDYACLLRPSIGGRLTDKDIPDALITLDQKVKWRALIEVKIGANDLNQAQLGRYLNRVSSEEVDALITISNEMCTNPSEPPLRLKPAEKRLRNIPHYHWSWRYILHQAEIISKSPELIDIEKTILNQFIDFLKNEKSGIHGYNSMPKCWPEFVDTLRDGGRPSDEDLDDVIAGWFQETSDLSLILSEEFGVKIVEISETNTLELKRDVAENHLKTSRALNARFLLPNRSYINVFVDIKGRCLKFETAHLPTDKVKTPYKQIERFLDKFRNSDTDEEWGDHSNVRLFGRWSRYKDLTDISMMDAMINAKDDTLHLSKIIHPKSENLTEIIIQYTPSGAAKHMRNRKKMIDFLETQIKFFAQTYV